MLDTKRNHWSDADSIHTRQELEDEYDQLLHNQTVAELRAAASRWGIQIKGTRKADIVRQLAAWLNDPSAIHARIDELDDLGRQVLTYLHLALAPDYGMAADTVVGGMTQQKELARQQVAGGARLPTDAPGAGRSPSSSRPPGKESAAALQARIATLSERGLLLPFKQGAAVYYSLPTAVRLCLPNSPDLLSGYDQASEPRIVETTIGRSIQTIYAIWMAIAKGAPGTKEPFTRQALPSHQARDNLWTALQGWNNDPDELEAITSGRNARNRYSSAALSWALTVKPPPHPLSEADIDVLRQQTGCTAPEIEFCYVLLEGLGALSGAPGETISVHSEAMFGFLRLSLPAKIRALWQVWTEDDAWSEMATMLRTKELRLRRTLTFLGFQPEDLYSEWQEGREAVLRFLTLLEPDRWVSIDRFLRVVYSVHPDLLYTQTDASVWWLESLKTKKQFGATIEDWQESHGQFILAMLQGPLYWLGLIRLGYDPAQDAAPKAFQLTPAGAYALGRSPALVSDAFDIGQMQAASGADRAACSIADNLTITLQPGHASLDLYDLVHAVGDLQEATPDRFVYRLSASKVFRWAEVAANQDNAPLSSSDAIETLIASLNEHCGPPGEQPQVAAGWQRKLRTWGRNYGQLHVYENLTLLELADEYALQELLVSTSLGEHLVYQFSPHLVAIHSDAVDPLVQEMEGRGYTPRVK